VDIRPATDGDRVAINALLRTALNAGDDPRYDAFLEWKHRANPFGPSYEWVAVEGDGIIGYRSFLRWELAVDGEVARAVRAVDTATDPRHQGKGIFSKLTLHGVDALREDGISWIFNTPNDQSRPGYLKMGWSVVGKLPVAVMARTPLALRHARRARQPAARWSEPAGAFEPAVDAIDRVLGETAPAPVTGAAWATNRTPAFLRWRYGFADLHYRGFVLDDESVVVFRVRQRGPLREAMIADVVRAPGASASARLGSAVRRILRATRADVGVISGRARPATAIPVSGPLLTWRPVADPRVPPLDSLAFCGGDVELF
jgi:GNAT superfamily N-acetyltransferase